MIKFNTADNVAEINIVAFEPDLEMDIKSWLVYFYKLSTKGSKKTDWKLENISNIYWEWYLKSA